jgi:hypothetical protein
MHPCFVIVEVVLCVCVCVFCEVTFLESISASPAWYKVVQIWPGLFVCKQVTVCPGHIWTTLYIVLGLGVFRNFM